MAEVHGGDAAVKKILCLEEKREENHADWPGRSPEPPSGPVEAGAAGHGAGWAHDQGSVRQGGCGPEPTAQIAGAPARCPARRERALAALHPHTGCPSPTATHGGSWHPDSGGLLARVLYFRFVSSRAAEVHGGSILGVRMEGASFQSGRVCSCWFQASYRTTVASILRLLCKRDSRST